MYGWRYTWGRTVRAAIGYLCLTFCVVIIGIAAWKHFHRVSYVTTYGNGDYSVSTYTPTAEPVSVSSPPASVSPVSASPLPSKHTVTVKVTVTRKPTKAAAVQPPVTPTGGQPING